MKIQQLNLQQLNCILDEANIINTKRHTIDVLIHTIKHSDFGIASIMENSVGGGVLIYGQTSKKQHRLFY